MNKRLNWFLMFANGWSAQSVIVAWDVLNHRVSHNTIEIAQSVLLSEWNEHEFIRIIGGANPEMIGELDEAETSLLRELDQFITYRTIDPYEVDMFGERAVTDDRQPLYFDPDDDDSGAFADDYQDDLANYLNEQNASHEVWNNPDANDKRWEWPDLADELIQWDNEQRAFENEWGDEENHADDYRDDEL